MKCALWTNTTALWTRSK